jgi:hypothetical protein
VNRRRCSIVPFLEAEAGAIQQVAVESDGDLSGIGLALLSSKRELRLAISFDRLKRLEPLKPLEHCNNAGASPTLEDSL